jgi:hypothetical protein
LSIKLNYRLLSNVNKKDLCSHYLLKLKKILSSNLKISPKNLPYT